MPTPLRVARLLADDRRMIARRHQDHVNAQLNELAERATASNDPRLGVAAGRRILQIHPRLMPPCPSCRAVASDWFAWALDFDPDLRWDVAEAWQTTLHREAFAAAMRHAVTTAYPTAESPGITTDVTLFAVNPVEGLHMAFAIRSDQPDRAAAALAGASPRLMLTGWAGQEFASVDDLEAAEDADQSEDAWRGLGTPSYVSDIEVVDGRPRIWLDLKDSESVAQARAMLTIVVQELELAGVGTAEIGAV
jgi:hypothetical protein